MVRRAVVIPAVKKNVAFDNDLVKKLDDRLLLQHAIDKALRLEKRSMVWVVTDSQEIELIAQRAGVRCVRDATLRIEDNDLRSLAPLLDRVGCECPAFLVLWPYAPLLGVPDLEAAWSEFVLRRHDAMVSVRKLEPELYLSHQGLQPVGLGLPLYRKIRAFEFLSRAYLEGGDHPVQPWVVEDPRIEIASFRDWWVCEKLLRRRRIVFRVIGSNSLGMGHIYRALTLAHEISDHEIVFQCSREHDVAVNKIAGYEYFLKVSEPDALTEDLLELHPDLVVLDALDTDAAEVRRLREHGIRVASFEDLGSGARETDLTINELYDIPAFEGGNVLWGHACAFLREEFHGAKRHRFEERIRTILLTFGGADPSDMTMSVLAAVEGWCRARGIGIHIVCGTAYLHKDRLRAHIAASGGGIEATFETGVMSRIMESCQLAISSNGRTAYELAHMRLPSLILEHNEREHTHKFTSLENGFVNLGVWRDLGDHAEVLRALERLVDDAPFRRGLHEAMSRFDFVANKARVVKSLLALVEDVPR